MWFSLQNTLIAIFGYPLSYIEFIGTFTGLVSVWLAMRANIWTWPTGLINVICFFIIFFQVRLYADMFLQAYFFITSIYGWIYWANNKTVTPPTTAIFKQRVFILFIIIISTLVVGFFVMNIHTLFPSVFVKPASYPFTDTFVAVLSIIATILLAQKKTDNWVLWIIADIISVVLYAKKGVLFISIEYAVFLCLAISGLLTWLKLMRDEKRINIR